MLYTAQQEYSIVYITLLVECYIQEDKSSVLFTAIVLYCVAVRQSCIGIVEPHSGISNVEPEQNHHSPPPILSLTQSTLSSITVQAY